MEIVSIGPITVDNEGMATTFRTALVAIECRVVNRTFLAHFFIYKILPTVSTVRGGTLERGGVAIAHNLCEGVEGIAVVCSGACEAVVHLCRLAAVAHQRCHGGLLSISVGAVKVVEHVAPIEGRGSPCRHIDFVGLRYITCETRHLTLGVLVVVGNLRHSRSDTACEGLIAIL